MAIPALKIEPEAPLEERFARLEINVEHIQKDVSDMKVDIRRLGDKIDAVDEKLTAKIDGVEQRLTAKIDGVEQRLATKIDGVDQRLTGKFDSLKDVVTALAINMEKQFAKVEKSIGDLRTARAFDRVWWLIMSAGILSIMARAFKWI
jgi:predicted  nucleic acid-binding Zn-ribbon protein